MVQHSNYGRVEMRILHIHICIIEEEIKIYYFKINKEFIQAKLSIIKHLHVTPN